VAKRTLTPGGLARSAQNEGRRPASPTSGGSTCGQYATGRAGEDLKGAIAAGRACGQEALPLSASGRARIGPPLSMLAVLRQEKFAFPARKRAEASEEPDPGAAKEDCGNSFDFPWL